MLITPETWVRDYIQAQRNHWPELEDASETLGGALNHPLSVAEPLRQRLKDAWGVEVRVVGPEVLEDASQHYDPQRRMLMLSSLLRPRTGSSESPTSSRCSNSRRSSPGCWKPRGRRIPAAAACCT